MRRRSIPLVLFLAALAVPFIVSAEDEIHMDFTRPITGVDGKPIIIGADPKAQVPLMLGDMCNTALDTVLESDKTMTDTERHDNAALSRRIYRAKDAVLTTHELDTIKTRIGKIVWQSHQIEYSALELLTVKTPPPAKK